MKNQKDGNNGEDGRSTELVIISIPNKDKDQEAPGSAVWKEEITDIDGERKLEYFGVMFKGNKQDIDPFISISIYC